MNLGGHRPGSGQFASPPVPDSPGREPAPSPRQRKVAHLLSVEVLRGEGLVACDLNGKSDPYYIATWLGGSGISSEPKKSVVVWKTLSPNWRDAMKEAGEDNLVTTSPTTLANVATLQVEVWDKDKVGKDDFMGVCKIPFSSASVEEYKSAEVEKYIPLESRPDKKDKVKGSIVVRIRYTSTMAGSFLQADRSLAAGARPKLTVQILKGEKLAAMDSTSSDPFYKAHWDGGSGYRSGELKSHVIKSTLNPNWAAHEMRKRKGVSLMTFEPKTPEDMGTLVIDVYDYDTLSGNDFMGRVSFRPSPQELAKIDGQWKLIRLPLADRDSEPVTHVGTSRTTLARSGTSALLSKVGVKGHLVLKVRYESTAQLRRRKQQQEAAKKVLADFQKEGLSTDFDAQEHPLRIIIELDQDRYLNLVNAFVTGMVTRNHTRRAIVHRASFEGLDAVDHLLYLLQTDEEWSYEALRPIIEEQSKVFRATGGTRHEDRCLGKIIEATIGGGGWKRADCLVLLQRMLDDHYLKRMTSGPPVFKDAKTLYAFESPGKSELEAMKKRTGQKSIGRAMRATGARPNFPVVLVPGLASSALEVWDSEECPEWIGERVWIDINKIGSLAQLQKIKNMLRSKKSDEQGNERVWLRHLCPEDDGFSDPPGIKVRPCEGLGAIDYLSHNPLTMKPTYVWAYVIRALIDLGYDRKNLIAAPYDWRIPPGVLESRDAFFSKLKADVEVACKANGKRVVLIGHSMGNRNLQWFLWWLNHTDPGFIDKNIHAYMALGAPLLGATKVIRSFMTGDALGLDMFLEMKEGLHFAHRLGSLPWLLPLYHPMYTNPIARVRDEDKTPDRSGDWGPEDFTTPHSFSLVKKYAIRHWATFNKFYGRCEWYLDRCEGGGSQLDENGEPLKDAELPPILRRPPVDNIWCIYGVNLPTETAYYFKEKDGKISADKTMDRESQRITPNNPSGLKIVNGVGFEISDTPQPFLDGAARSGDGTLPYSSMAYARVWQQEEDSNVDIIEVEGAEHREMMSDECIIYHILQYVVEGENQHAEHPANRRQVSSTFSTTEVNRRSSTSGAE